MVLLVVLRYYYQYRDIKVRDHVLDQRVVLVWRHDALQAMPEGLELGQVQRPATVSVQHVEALTEGLTQFVPRVRYACSMCHVSCATHSSSMCHVSCAMCHTLELHVSCVMYSCVMCHVLMCHVSRSSTWK